ncbi:hemolysin III [Frondihabitans sp. PAMC 28766]|uniref:PAQR family membrane homeostasis protein TrhA n=1 Tax=Frondihabitans sp. PAMC 28766 TaxID=1795630 RepID=UPI00078D9D86|nr:hemolysin III family protein [Frondihabitans sp. PAMC 28766]AMM20238.1 hemolysin III [Frondihabitans sp. PAMC 28766]
MTVLPEIKPTWRGWIHAGTFPLAVALGVVLVTLAAGAPAKAATAIYFGSSLLLFGVSATYHRGNWRPKAKLLLKRMDHSNIFLLIAGTYTPIAVLALPRGEATTLLILVWSGALAGIAFRVFWTGAPRWLYTPLYVLLGVGALIYVGDIFEANAATMILVLAGGVFYIAGAVVYGTKRPNIVPGVFGFHELFHAFTVVAFCCQWTAVLLLAVQTR